MHIELQNTAVGGFNYVFDWLEQVFSPEGAGVNPMPSELIAVSKKHHGDEIMRGLSHMGIVLEA